MSFGLRRFFTLQLPACTRSTALTIQATSWTVADAAGDPQVSLEGAADAVFGSRVLASLEACIASTVAPATEEGLGLDCFLGTDMSVALSIARCRLRSQLEALSARFGRPQAASLQSPLALLEARLNGEEYDLVRARASPRGMSMLCRTAGCSFT